MPSYVQCAYKLTNYSEQTKSFAVANSRFDKTMSPKYTDRNLFDLNFCLFNKNKVKNKQITKNMIYV